MQDSVTDRFGQDTLAFTYTYKSKDGSYSSAVAPADAGTYTVTVALATLPIFLIAWRIPFSYPDTEEERADEEAVDKELLND